MHVYGRLMYIARPAVSNITIP